MKFDLNKDLIEGLRDSTNDESISRLNGIVSGLITEVMEELSAKSSFIQLDKVILEPVNEIYLGAICACSEYTYFLGVANKEIELNSLDKKHYIKNLWKRFVNAWRVSRSKTQKKKKNVAYENSAPNIRNITKYTIDDLKSDVVRHLANFVTPSTIIYEYYDHISILGKEDFGSNVKINIYICMYDEKNEVYKLYNNAKNRFFDIDFKQRFNNLNSKIQDCGNNFINMVKVFNSLFSKAYNKVPNQILIESLLFACPNKLYKDDLYETFINIANFIRLNDVTAIRSICDNSKSIFKDKLILGSNGQIDFSRFIKLLDSYKI